MKNVFKLCLVFVLLLAFSNGFAQQQSRAYKFDLTQYRDTLGKTNLIKTVGEWEKRRQQILNEIQLVMGPLPDASKKRVPLDMKIIEEVKTDKVRRMKITFAVEKEDRVSAYLLIPSEIKGRVPGIVCLHQTIAIGKEEPTGLGGNPNLYYALELAKRGYVTIVPDYPNFGEYKVDPYQEGYVSTTMKGIWNHKVAIDLLQSLKEVDPKRIGCIGHSLGGHNSLFLAVFDKRIKVVVTSCGFTSFYKYYKGDLTGWSSKKYMPRIETEYEKNPENMPFDFSEILGALAPRPLFINAPLRDENFENSGVYDCVNAALPVYKLFKASHKVILVTPDCAHSFPTASREQAYSFLDKALKLNK